MWFRWLIVRVPVLFLALSNMAFGQNRVEAGFGIRGGVLTSESFQAHTLCVDTACAFVSSSFTADQISGTVGPAVNVLLNNRVEIRFEAVYRRFAYQVHSDIFLGPQSAVDIESTRGHLWEYPLLATYHFGSGPIRPFAGGGVSFPLTGAGTTETQYTLTTQLSSGPVTTTTVARNAAMIPSATPFYLAGGVDGRISHFSIRPEFRYSHFSVDQTSNAEVLFKPNQFEFLVGVSWQLPIKKPN